MTQHDARRSSSPGPRPSPDAQQSPDRRWRPRPPDSTVGPGLKMLKVSDPFAARRRREPPQACGSGAPSSWAIPTACPAVVRCSSSATTDPDAASTIVATSGSFVACASSFSVTSPPGRDRDSLIVGRLNLPRRRHKIDVDHRLRHRRVVEIKGDGVSCNGGTLREIPSRRSARRALRHAPAVAPTEQVPTPLPHRRRVSPSPLADSRNDCGGASCT